MEAFGYSNFRTQSEPNAGVLIWQTVSPVLIVLGTVGNVLSIIVLSNRKFNRWASSLFLLGLACADLTVLYVGLFRQWIKYLLDTDIRSVNSFFCKIHWWLMYASADNSVWILTAITCERLISTLCPYKSKLVCTKLRAKIVLIGIAVGALLINSHLLYGFGRVEIHTKNLTTVIPCAPLTDEYSEFFEKVWTWVDLCKFSLIPFALLSSGNVCIIYKLLVSRKRVAPSVGNNSSIQTSISQRTSNMSILLVCLNFMFIISTLPVCIYFIGEPYWVPRDVPRAIQLQDPWWAVVNMLMYLNNTCNFIFYCMTGSRFRTAVRNMFAFACKRKAKLEISTLKGLAYSRSGAM